MKRERESGSAMSEGEIAQLFEKCDPTIPRYLLRGCFLRTLIEHVCPNISETLLQKALQYFLRAKMSGLYEERHMENWRMVGSDDGVMVERPCNEDQVSAVIDFFLFCQLVMKIFGVDAGIFDGYACCKEMYRFMSRKEIAKREFYLFQFGLHCHFD